MQTRKVTPPAPFNPVTWTREQHDAFLRGEFKVVMPGTPQDVKRFEEER